MNRALASPPIGHEIHAYFNMDITHSETLQRCNTSNWVHFKKHTFFACTHLGKNFPKIHLLSLSPWSKWDAVSLDSTCRAMAI